MVLNMYNKKKKDAGVCSNICFFSVFPTIENSIFLQNSPYIRK
ncbi:hypothetical protein TSAR_008904 [Trichomalopsis sarcophagae]|uniref:Uncharacterized protein n=1 Tax=Trichomalopsis sarcophagae TaxID=543379 RepID=A0A232EVH5_9HYME|nr:hypothetical protein TSAR_008904 [Trichomalopsis sarcophagae]